MLEIKKLNVNDKEELSIVANWLYYTWTYEYNRCNIMSVDELVENMVKTTHGTQCTLVGRYTGQVAGVVSIEFYRLRKNTSRKLWLTMLYVNPEYRGLGFAKELIRCILDTVGNREVYLWTRSKLMKLFEPFGFILHERLEYHNGDVVMKKY